MHPAQKAHVTHSLQDFPERQRQRNQERNQRNHTPPRPMTERQLQQLLANLVVEGHLEAEIDVNTGIKRYRVASKGGRR